MLKSSLKLALKVLARRKVFTAISLVGISLTLVVLTIATAVIDNLVAPRAPQSNLDRMLVVTSVSKRGPNVTMTSNPGRAFLDTVLRDLPGAELVSYETELSTAVIYQGAGRIELPVRRVDGNFWRMTDFHFLAGGPFSSGDSDAGRAVCVIGDDTARQVFGTTNVLGRSINVTGQSYRIVGVVPQVPLTQTIAYSTVWLPLGPGTTDERAATFGNIEGVVLARSTADIKPIQREFQQRVKRLPIDDPKIFNEYRSDLDTTFESLARAFTFNQMGDRGPMVFRIALLALAILFMTLPALNLVTLNLSRILERAPEVGVRKAFGAPPRTLIGQFVMENVVLTLIGGALAFVLAFIAVRGLSSLELLPGVRFELNPRVFAWGMLTAAFFGVFSGLYPAWKMARLNPVNALRGGAM